MSEAHAPHPSDAMVEPSEPRPIVVDMEVNSLPYLLTGALPEEPSSFELVASLPEDVWRDLEPQIEQIKSENDWFARIYRQTQQSLHLGDGKIGSVWVSVGESPDDKPTIHVDRIQTELGYVPEGSKYHNAKGVGSAILDNLCAIADTRGWRITLYPLERDGRLMGTDLQDWYRRRGFKFRFEEKNKGLKNSYPREDMMRFPQEPDTSQPITNALEEQKPQN